MTLRSPQPLPARFRRKVGPLTRRIVDQYHRSSWRYRWERWWRVWGRVKAKVKEWKRHFWIITGSLLMIVLAGAVSILLFSSAFHVKEIRVRRSDLRVDSETVERILGPFFGRHVLFVHVPDVETLLKTAMPDTDHILLQKEYPARLTIDVKLKPLVVGLILAPAGDEGKISSGTGHIVRDFLTEDGLYMQYREAQVSTASTLPVIRLVDWGIKPQPGRFLLEPHFLQRMFEAEKLLRERFGQNVRTRTVFLRSREFHLAVDAYTVWFDEQSPLVDQIGRYTLFLKTIGGERPLQYVDLRLRDRVVYR